jgi:hypothetical protein
MGKLRVTYAMFLAPVNPAWREILDIELGKQSIAVVGDNHERIDILASDIRTIGAS